MGRPSSFTPEIADEICTRLAAGESLRTICKLEHMPDRSTVTNWLTKDEEFHSQYARARDVGLDNLADELLEIADTPEEGSKKTDKPSGVETTTGDMIDHRRLKVDTRKWYLSKLAPKRYGEATRMELTGANGGPMQFTDTERAARISALIGLAEQRRADNVDDLV